MQGSLVEDGFDETGKWRNKVKRARHETGAFTCQELTQLIGLK